MTTRFCLSAALLSVVWLITGSRLSAQTVGHITTFPETSWETRTPAELGLDAAGLESFASAIGGSGLIIKDGFQAMSWGPQNVKHDWLSAAKPLTSTLMLFAVDEGRLQSVDTRVAPYVEQRFGKPLASEDSLITFAQLANMTSGYALPSDPGPDTRWGYNDYAINLFSKLLSDVVFAASLNSVATSGARLGSLRFQDGSIYSTRQGHGVFTTPRDFARIGWFWLNRGYWDGTQLLPEGDFETLLSPGAASDLPRTSGGLDDYLNVGTFGGGTDQTGLGPGSYGFGLWLNTDGKLWPDVPWDAYQANGGWNRYAVTVIPSLKLVAVWVDGPVSDAEDFAAEMNLSLKILVEAAQVSISVSPGWSQVSIPVATDDMTLSGLFGGAATSAFRFEDGRYVPVDTLEVGSGYLISSSGATVTLSGRHVLPERIPVTEGWNLVGVFHRPVTPSEVGSDPPDIVDSQFHEHVGKNDATLSILQPGKAYWVRVSQNGYLIYHNDPEDLPASQKSEHAVEKARRTP